VSTLSGGERARVALAILIAQERNLLVLDEPTNYLDIPSRHAVEEALAAYNGSIIVVTHDRYFLDSVCNRIGIIKDKKLDMYNCTYSELKAVQARRGEPSSKDDEYVVVSGFKEWVSGTVYKRGEIVIIRDGDMERFRWALETGKLRKAGGR
jgi:ATP-binding cassette subfamily F protein 3